MIIIFWLSSRTADESAAQSGRILQMLIGIFGDNMFTQFIVRKAAHFSEFAGLAFLFNIAFFQTCKRKMPLVSIALTSLYAATDEFHQLFVPGRSCQFSDWAIDTCGAAVGTLIFFAVILVTVKICEKKKKLGDKFVDSENN